MATSLRSRGANVTDLERDGNRFLSDLRCPICTSPVSRVLNSRNAYREGALCRRRECVSCGSRFSTAETLIEDRHLSDGGE